jgi:hypothetical protein
MVTTEIQKEADEIKVELSMPRPGFTKPATSRQVFTKNKNGKTDWFYRFIENQPVEFFLGLGKFCNKNM